MATAFDWTDLFRKNESPYFSMFRAGIMGVPIEDCIALCTKLGIVLRTCDTNAWQDGRFNYEVKTQTSVLNPIMRPPNNVTQVFNSKLTDFEKLPTGWKGKDARWFPCSLENKPLQKWGYSEDYTPTLYTRESAQALSQCGWVGQNMYAQPFIVFDIDGVGHGETDPQVIEFGERYRNHTETWENPAKPGSFHLYFNTPYLIPITHFGYAKLDLMGNQKNAAVYTKSKQPNGIPRADLTEEIWADLQEYVKTRKEQRDNGKTI